MLKLIPLSILVSCFLSCNQKQAPQQNNNGGITSNNLSVAKDTIPLSSWQVKGCAEKSIKADTKFPSSGEFNDYPDLPGDNEIKAEGDSIIYSRFVHHGCCRKAEVSTHQHERVITIVEYWTGSICKCMCNSSIRAVIKKLPKGEYQVYAIETGTNPMDNKPSEGRDTVMSQKVTIK